jgi:hypothetical protein
VPVAADHPAVHAHVWEIGVAKADFITMTHFHEDFQQFGAQDGRDSIQHI